jgi:hypothetical protein
MLDVEDVRVVALEAELSEVDAVGVDEELLYRASVRIVAVETTILEGGVQVVVTFGPRGEILVTGEAPVRRIVQAEVMFSRLGLVTLLALARGVQVLPVEMTVVAELGVAAA